MKHLGWRRFEALALVVVLGLGVLSGCSDDETSGPPTNEVTPGWDRLFVGQGTDPAYAPDGSAAEGLLAFASFRSVTRADSATTHEHIWIADATATTFTRITSGNNDDYDPAWSPSGTKLVFTRDNGARRDIYWVDVSSPAAPGTPHRVTDRSLALTGATNGAWVVVDGEEQVVFSDGTDLWRIPTVGGSPIKLVPDPADFRPFDCGGVDFEDLDAVPDPAGTRLAVISRGRVATGAIRVTSRDQGGALLPAKLWVSPCDSLAINGTAATFANLPVGDYHVRGFRPGSGQCDTLDVVATVAAGTDGMADTSDVTLTFTPTTGTLMLRAISTDRSDFVYFLDCEPTSATATPASPLTPLDSLIYTPLACVEPGLHVLSATQGERLDTTWINVTPGQSTFVTLQFLDSTSVDTMLAGTSLEGIYPRGGEGSFFTRICQGDSVVVGTDPHGNPVYDCTDGQEPPASIPWTYRWAIQDTLCTPGAASPSRRLDAGRIARAPLTEGEAIWIFDRATGIFVPRVSEGQSQRPVWDPIPGHNRLAYVIRETGHWGIRIVDLDSGEEVSIGLPGRDGPFICVRDAISLTWSADGSHLVVALSPCGGGSYPYDLELWTADLTELGGL